MTTLLERPEGVAPAQPPAGTPPGPPAQKPRSWRSRLLSEGALPTWLFLIGYVILGGVLDFHYRIWAQDAVARQANGFSVLFSRDPHLGAIGFVWNPLPSVTTIPFLLFRGVFPGLVTNNFAGSLASAVCMAGAVWQFRATLQEWGVSRPARLVMTLCFAANPMILYYAANGMSEALYLFTLLGTTRYLIRWLRTGSLGSLVYAATWLAFGYLARDETVGSAVLAAGVVLCVGWSRARGRGWGRVMTALSDCAIFLLPVATAFVGWAVISWVVVGQPFQQFSSKYGNASLVASGASEVGVRNVTLTQRLLFEAKALVAFSPFLAVLAVVALVVAARFRDTRFLAPVTVLGGALAFSMVSYAGGQTFGYFRYYIAALPLGILLVASLIGAMEDRQAPAGDGSRWPIMVGSAAVAVLLVAPSLVSTGAGMFNPAVGGVEAAELGTVFQAHPSAADEVYAHRYGTVRAFAATIDRLHLPDGSIVVDNAQPCLSNFIMNVKNPKVFVIPNDRDYQRVLGDPFVFHARYVLDPNPRQIPSASDTVAQLYPGIFDTGGGFTALAHNFPAGGGCPQYHLLQVTGIPPSAVG